MGSIFMVKEQKSQQIQIESPQIMEWIENDSM